MSTSSSSKETSNKNRLLTVYKIAALAIAAANIVAAVLCYLFSYDSNIGYFDSSAFVTVFYVLLALCVIFAISAAAVLPKSISPKKAPLGNSFAVSAIPATAFLIYGIYSLYIMIISKESSAIGILLALTALVSFVFFLISFKGSKLSLSAYILLGIFPIINMFLTVAKSYFNYTVEMNSPDKLLLQFAALSAMLYLTSELRFSTQKPRPRLYIASSVLAMSLCGIVGISAFSYSISVEKFKLTPSSFHELLTGIIFLSLSIYVSARLVSLSLSTSSAEGPKDGAELTETAECPAADSSSEAAAAEENTEISESTEDTKGTEDTESAD